MGFNSVLNKMLLMTNANVDSMRVHHETWAQQLKDAMNVNGGDVENASTGDYIMHFLTFVALGTSLPDTFASKAAATAERTADNAIGNVTGSNSVNVFLGLGLPWLIASIFWSAKGKQFIVKDDALGFSVMLYSITAILAIILLMLRRKLNFFGNAELGGTVTPKYVSGIILVLLWFSYVLLSSLQAYEKIKAPF